MAGKLADKFLHVSADVKLRDLREERDEWKSRYEQAREHVGELEKKVSVIDWVQKADVGGKVWDLRLNKRRGVSTAVAVASDWHIEERVRGQTVNGRNEYDLRIAEARARKFFESVISLTEMARSKSEVKTLVLALLGDFISGHIHEELHETCQLSPQNAMLKSVQWIAAGIDMLLAHGGFDEIVIPCTGDNHGRTTIKKRISTQVDHSHTVVGYYMLKWHFETKGENRVKFILPDGYFVTLNVYDKLVRFHHGDGIMYQGGVGGIHIPLRKAISQWNKAMPVYLDVLGHWHSRQSAKDYVVNGSLIGYSPLSIAFKSDFEPPCQTFFLMHPTYGKTIECPILVGE